MEAMRWFVQRPARKYYEVDKEGWDKIPQECCEGLVKSCKISPNIKCKRIIINVVTVICLKIFYLFLSIPLTFNLIILSKYKL